MAVSLTIVDRPTDIVRPLPYTLINARVHAGAVKTPLTICDRQQRFEYEYLYAC